MKPWALTAGVAGCALVALLHGQAQGPRRNVGPNGWYTSYYEARAVARQTGKPLMVVFRCQP